MTFETHRLMISLSYEKIQNRLLLTYNVCFKNQSTVIGTIQLRKYARKEVRTWFLSIWINKNFRGNGYANEAIRAILDDIFKTSDNNLILCSCKQSNTLGIAFLRKIGMCSTLPPTDEIITQNLLFSISRQHWQKITLTNSPKNDMIQLTEPK